ncbi:hypothetical protein JaAD80_14295 [Janthinobacterium sp. AD80]|nr:hypothetical protein JaAD80_14295 [Janthinobacterium sp. AD80]
MQTNPEKKDTELRLKVNSETARLAWSELEKNTSPKATSSGSPTNWTW